MRVRQLQSFLKANGMIGQTSLESLRGLRIGFEASYWFRTITQLKDPYGEALGGLPPSVFHVIARELEQLSKLDIHPVFVFDGMAPPLQHHFFQNPQVPTGESPWTLEADGRRQEAQTAFSLTTSRINNDLVHYLYQFLKTRGYDCIRAPYSAGPQLASMAASNQLQAVFCQAGSLMYGIRRVILYTSEPENPSNKIVGYVDLDHVLQCLSVNLSQFMDACLFAGSEFCLTLPLMEMGNNSINFYTAVEIARNGTIMHYVSHLPEDIRTQTVEGFCIAKALALYSPVLRDNQVEPLNPGAPEDLSKLIGGRLPTSLYGLLAVGVISHRVPQVLATGEWSDKTPPLVDTEEYRSGLVDMIEYRKKALGLIAEACPGLVPRGKKIAFKSYWENSNNHNSPAVSSVGGQVSTPQASATSEKQKCRQISIKTETHLKWQQITKDEVAQEMKRQGVESVDMRFCLKWHARDSEFGGPIQRAISGEESPLVTNAKKSTTNMTDLDTHWIVCQSLFSFLEACNYFTDDGSATVLGDIIKDTHAGFQESLLLAIELMKFGLLSGNAFELPSSKPAPKGVTYPSSTHSPAIALLIRTLSLLPMRLKGELWSSEIDFDLAAFHCIVRSMNRVMRSVIESSVSHVILKDMKLAKCLPCHLFSPTGPTPTEIVDKIPHDSGPAPLLPSFVIPRACMGIVGKFFLNYQSKGNDVKQFEADLKTKFPGCVDPLRDLKVAFRFWKEVVRCVTAINEQIDDVPFINDLKQADALLDQKRKLIGL